MLKMLTRAKILWALVATLYAGSVARAGDSPATLRRASDHLRAEAAILKADGDVQAAVLRADRFQLYLTRLADLLQSHSISERAYAEVKRDAELAQVAVEESRTTLAKARKDKERLEAETSCDVGGCDNLVQTYTGLRRLDAELAGFAIKKLDLKIAFDEASVAAYRELAARGAIDPGVVPEMEKELAAKKVERESAEKVWEQLRIPPG